MAENNVEPDWSVRPQLNAEDTLLGMESLLATLRALEDELKQHELSETYSTEYCDNFCQILMHYAGSRNSVEHGLSLLEAYCLSINCFAAARPYLTAEFDSVALVLKRLALSCFELLLSVPDNEIPYDTWVQFHQSVQVAHEALLQYGSTDLQALLQITGEGGAWSNPILAALLTGQPTNTEDVDAYIALEGEGFMEMRVKHLEKVGEVAKAVVLAKVCTESCHISNHATFRHTYVSLLCHLLPNQEAITEISRLDCKDVLEITCNLETEGEERTAFILCTTVLTQQLQQQSLYCSRELTLLWSKLQKRIDPSLESLLERCLQLGAIANTVNHLFYLVRIIQTEAEEMGLASSVELCVKALQLPKKEDAETRISVCRTISCVLQEDLEVLRACQLTEFLLGPCQDAFGFLEELYLRPDQKYDQENPIIPNSLRCELLLALKAHWPFDPEFWDWKTLKYHCSGLLGLEPESQEEGRLEGIIKHVEQVNELGDGSTLQTLNMLNSSGNGQEEEQGDRKSNSTAIAQSKSKSKKPKFFCQICERLVSATQILHHSKRHVQNNIYTCPICLETFQIRKDFICHTKQLHQMALTGNCEKANRRIGSQDETDEKEVKPVQSSVDPSLMLPHQATHDMPPPHHIVEQTKSATVKQTDKDEHVTFEYINTYFPLQNHDRYWCPASRCTKMFKHSKNLYIHLKAEHKGDQNVEHYYKMRDRREKCVFCRRHFVSSYHLRKHQKVHLTDDPFMCVSVGCNSRFSFTNDLVSHRQTHGYQLNYQCELKGCYATFSDLAHLFHHEAQHFRDAAFSCTSPDCKKFFFSKKEFTEHLARHGITYTEEDFETQRKSKLKLLKIVIANSLRAKSGSSKKLSDSLTVLEDTNKSSDLASSSSSSASLSNVPNSNEEMNMTPVAVCFDGSKFTCGFEKCGMTFSRARDVQRHLNCAHPEHLRSENKEHKKRDKEKGSNSKVPKLKTQQNDVEKSKYDHIHTSKGSDPEKILSMPPNNNETTSGLTLSLLHCKYPFTKL
ncbi:zinc finger protein Rlf [Aplochiton taeniatus]